MTFGRIIVSTVSADSIEIRGAVAGQTPYTGTTTVQAGTLSVGNGGTGGTGTSHHLATALFSSSQNNLRESRNTVVDAINAISAQTGVTAVNSDSDARGISLVAADGRNIEVALTTLMNERAGLGFFLQVRMRQLLDRVFDEAAASGALATWLGWITPIDRRVILLSDGCANEGLVDHDPIYAQCAEFARAHPAQFQVTILPFLSKAGGGGSRLLAGYDLLDAL